MKNLSKAVLVQHLGEFHGNHRVVMDPAELRRWSVHELRTKHAHLMESGPCPLERS